MVINNLYYEYIEQFYEVVEKRGSGGSEGTIRCSWLNTMFCCPVPRTYIGNEEVARTEIEPCIKTAREVTCLSATIHIEK